MCIRRGFILPIMLLILVLLGMLVASGSFYVHADLAATRSMALRLQARMAAEAGLQKVMLFLRENREDVDAWYDNPEEFHRVIVWSDTGEQESFGTTEEYEDDTQAWRFSIVADDPTDDEVLVRFGITDEASKVNINTASADQLRALISQFTTEEMNVDELVDALIDWRDTDQAPGTFGAEREYYSKLDPPYAVKNGPFDTVEELLLVRGFTPDLLYGEDYDRNGLMSPNEDDGDLRFPPDNADSELNRGLHPYVTVYSKDTNSAADNRPRVYLFSDAATVTAQLSPDVDDPAKVEFVAGAAAQQPRITSLAQLLEPRTDTDGQEVLSPLTQADMGWINDRLTLSQSQETVGLININTAGRQVLASLPSLTEEDVSAILETRAALDSESKSDAGWVSAVIGAEKFGAISALLTTRAMRFHVESLGYADHVGTMARLEAIIEMRGPIAQIIYLRDLTTLGTSFPISYAEGDADLVGFDR